MKLHRILNLSQIAYCLWIVYFASIYILGNVYYQLPAYLGYYMAFLMLVYKLIKQEWYTEFPFNFKSVTLWYGVFYIWEYITGFWTPSEIAAVSNTPYQTLRIVAIFMAMDFYVATSEDVNKLIKAFCIGATAFAAWTIASSPISSYGTLKFGAATGQQRNTTGYVLCFATFLLIYLFVRYKKKYWLFASLLCLLASLLTGSRKIIFAYIVAVILVIIGQKDFKFTLKYFFIIAISAAIIIPAAYQIPYVREAFGERLLAVLDDSIEDSSIMYRNIAKYNAIRIFIENPILGNGWAAVRNSFNFNGVSIYAHNNYLEIAADYGIIGVVLFFTRNVVYEIKCFTRMKKNKLYLIATILLTAMMLLDWGQVSYVYVYMMCIWGVVYKFVQYECFYKEEEEN